MNFRNWLEGIEKYEPFRAQIDRIAREFPFAHWFPEGNRTYIPFDASIRDSETKREIANILSDFKGGYRFPATPQGYEIVDWQGGYAKPKGHTKANVFRIGKILNTLETVDLQEIKEKYERGGISPHKYNFETNQIRNYFNELRISFENDPTRAKGTQYYVVISADPHDLASMSTGRPWTSCMNLIDGGQKQDVYCEVKKGGFVAYLIHAEDREIEKPLARIHIRHFRNRKGQSLALPEETVYGQEMPGFLETVKQWLSGKQGHVRPGRYKRRGGEHSDTFGDETVMPPRTKKGIKSWIEKCFEENVYKTMPYFDAAYAALLESDYKWDKEFLEKLRDYLFRGENWFRGRRLDQFALKFPEVIEREHLAKILKLSTHKSRKQLLMKFSHLIDKDLLKGLRGFDREQVLQTKEELRGANRELVKQEIEDALNIDNPSFQDREKSKYLIVSEISEIIELAKSLTPIPEPIARKLIQFANDVDKLYFVQDEKEDKHPAPPYQQSENYIIRTVVNAFAMTKTDIPIVQRFYKSLLPKWTELGGIGEFGWAIMQLGENGRQFLPFLRKMRNQFAEQKDLPRYEDTLDSYDYVIDAIESGLRRSQKYNFSFGVLGDAIITRKLPWKK